MFMLQLAFLLIFSLIFGHIELSDRTGNKTCLDYWNDFMMGFLHEKPGREISYSSFASSLVLSTGFLCPYVQVATDAKIWQKSDVLCRI